MKPTFFISSTIYDFRDLRSCIKWWLEEFGYKVNASEYNDFDKPLDENSYESCLRAIDKSDYFILLLGERFGGIYDKDISITQMEYRYAYQRMLEGKIKLINFVRQDTLTKMDVYKESIKDQTIDLTKFDKASKEKHRIHLFIQDVRRVNDMKDGGTPKNNWLHQFNGFPEIQDVIKAELDDRIGLSYKTKRFIITEELISNLKTYLQRDAKFGLVPRGFISEELFSGFKLDLDTPTIELTRMQQTNLGVFYITFWQSRKMQTSRIENIYNEGFFLEYDNETNDYVSQDFNRLASSVLNYYTLINNLHNKLYENYAEVIVQLQSNSQRKARVSASLIVNSIRFCESLVNCMKFSRNLYRKLYHMDYEIPKHQQNLKIYPEESLADPSEFANHESILEYFKI
ncbi:DUF4062 domain-containing protein [Chryseobacterium capnotolerans]|uniref:DUF4062 domain-containing protein n=1 Tax=Chryseobacterium TaxID=59732 RepID=UPI00083B0224|nr:MULTISPECIES: DUF4062 domain-containing protein [Chryseobacterium]UHO37101.1 DUF4062 domain-containing protein [Chryseobacterium capnotolerans]